MKKDPIKMIIAANSVGEPTFTIRAKDYCSIAAIEAYVAALKERVHNNDDVHLYEFIRQIEEIEMEFHRWRTANRDKCKYPD